MIPRPQQHLIDYAEDQAREIDREQAEAKRERFGVFVPPPPKPPTYGCRERFDIDLANGGRCLYAIDRATNEYREYPNDFWGGVALGKWMMKTIYQIGKTGR